MAQYRKARMTDTENIHHLINTYAEQGLMLPRSRSMIYESLREFTIVESDGGEFLGVGGLHIIWEDLAEVRALALSPNTVGKGIGKELIEVLVNEAKDLGVRRVFALTYQTEFFKRCGFEVIQKEEMSPKVWKECINCPKFPNCDEVAMIRNIE